MALNRTTLTSAKAASDTVLQVAAATGIAIGYEIRIDDEVFKVTKGYVAASLSVPVLCGQNGTAVSAHPVTAGVLAGASSDVEWGTIGGPQVDTHYPIAGRVRRIVSYSADGTIVNPLPGTDLVAELNSTVALNMTLAVPGKANDGDLIYVIGNGKAAHVLTVAGGIGAGGTNLDTNTFAAGANIMMVFMAMNSVWVAGGVMSGTLTNITVTAT